MTVFTYNELHQQTYKYQPFVVSGTLPTTAAEVYTALAAVSPQPDYEQRSYDTTYGRLESVTDYKQQVTTYAYTDGSEGGQKGLLKTQTFYNGAEATANRRSKFEFTYDKLGGRQTETIIEYATNGTTVNYQKCYANVYTEDGQIDCVKVYASFADYPGGTVLDSIGYGYDPITGRKELACTPESGTISTQVDYTYDNLGRLHNVKAAKRNGYEPASPGENNIYGYTPVGSRASLKYANNNYTEYGYDALNRLTNLTNYQTDQKTTTLSSFSYTHYADGMRHTLTENLAEPRVITYTYDYLNRLQTETAVEQVSDGHEYKYVSDYDYDLAGNRFLRTVEIKDGQTVIETLESTYDYNSANDRLLREKHNQSGAQLCYLDGKKYYAYSDGRNIMYYQKAGSSEKIGSFKAFVLGLPSPWGTYSLQTLLGLLPVMFLLPVAALLMRRLRKTAVQKQRLSLFYRGLSVMLAYMTLLSPVCLEQLAQADIQYSQLNVTTWCSWIDCFDEQPRQHVVVEYGHWTGTYRLNGNFVAGYDDNGSMIEKFTWDVNNTPTDGSDDVEIERVEYTYNLQNRLVKVCTSTDGGQAWSVTEYKYDPQGNRVSKTVDSVTTSYLVDFYNHTGYSQVFVETTGSDKTCYVVGDDVLAQAKNSDTPKYLLYDGHGSTRQLVASNGSTIVDSYSYDAYGVMLGGNPQTPAATNLLYAGEQWDTSAQHYYLRARYYNPNNGLFNQVDPYSGNMQDPQSLHKYLYCQNNPINNIDPSGNEGIVPLLTGFSIRAMLFRAGLGTGIGAMDAALRGYSIMQGAAWGAAFGIAGPLIPFKLGLILSAYSVGEALADRDWDAAIFRGAVAVTGLGSYRYLNGMLKGGRQGGISTRLQNTRIAAYLIRKGWKINGGGNTGRPEEYIAGPTGGTSGSTYVDITAQKIIDGQIRTLRIQTVTTKATGVPINRELAAAGRIKQTNPNDSLLLVPKHVQNGDAIVPPPFGEEEYDDDSEW
jgi:RHS repeat-associated protein